MNFQASFYQYSYNNILLIMMQAPHSSFVAGFSLWKNKYNRYVRRGEKGIKVICPCYKKITKFKEPDNNAVFNDEEAEKEVSKVLTGYRLGTVFDVSQTEQIEGTENILPILVRGMCGNSDDERGLYEVLFMYFSSNYSIHEISNMSVKGSYNISTHEIHIKAELEYRHKIQSLCHEISHLYDFKLHPDMDIPRNQRELVAQSSSYCICLRLGISTEEYSFSYLRSWLKTPDELRMLAGNIQDVVSTILNDMEGSSDLSSFLKEE